MDHPTLGARIAAARKRMNMTQRQLGEKLQTTDKTISRWERNETEPDLASILKLVDIFGMTTDELIRGTSAKNTVTANAGNSAEKPPKTNYQISNLITVSLPLIGTITAAIFSFMIEYGIRTGDLARIDFRMLGFIIGLLFYVAAGILKAANFIKYGDANNKQIEKTISYGIYHLTSLSATGAVMLPLDLLGWLVVGSLFGCAAFVLLTLASWSLVQPQLVKHHRLTAENANIWELRKATVVYYAIAALILLWNAAAFGFYDEIYYVIFVIGFIPLTLLSAILYQKKKQRLKNESKEALT